MHDTYNERVANKCNIFNRKIKIAYSIKYEENPQKHDSLMAKPQVLWQQHKRVKCSAEYKHLKLLGDKNVPVIKPWSIIKECNSASDFPCST